MIHADYLSSGPYGSSKEDFSMIYYIMLYKTNKLWGGASLTPEGHNLDKLGRGLLDDAKCKISKL